MVKLILGHICAGKTTYSMTLVKKNNYTRLSMDDLKIMMFNKISSYKKHEDLVAAAIENTINLICGMDEDMNVVIDGFPLEMEKIKYLVSSYYVEIEVFQVNLFKANLRNKKRHEEDGIYIEPEEIKRYNEEVTEFVNSKEFAELSKSTKVTYTYNYEKKALNDLVM